MAAAPSADTGTRWAAVASAVLLPGFLIAAVLGFFARPDPPQERSAAAAQLEARMKGEPEVVLLGNSKVGTDIDAVALSRGLGLSVAAMHIKGTGAPIWYAVAAQRVFAAGHHPQLLVVYGPLDKIVETAVTSANQRAVLADQLTAPDPVLNAKVFGQADVSETWQRVQTHRTEFRASLTEAVRDGVVGIFLAPRGTDGLLAAGEAVAVPALGRVFGDEAKTDTTRHRAIPVVEGEDVSDRTASTAAETLVPDFIELARKNGAEIVFVRSPLGSRVRMTGVVAPELLRDTVTTMAAGGAAWLDLSDDGPPDSSYGDGWHMSRAGRDRFTPVLVAALREIGVGSGQAIRAASADTIRPPVAVTREGTPPPLPELRLVRGGKACDWQAPLPTLAALPDTALAAAGFGAVSPLRVREDETPLPAHGKLEDMAKTCTGTSAHVRGVMKLSPTGTDPDGVHQRSYALFLDPAVSTEGGAGATGMWVYPGTELRLELPDVTGTVSVVAAAPLGGSGAELSVAGRTVPLTEADGLWRASAPALAGPVVLRSPPDGPWLLVRHLAVGTPENPWFVLGRRPTEQRVELLAGAARFDAPPPALPDPVRSAQEAGWKPGLVVIPTTDLDVPSIDDAFDGAGVGCSALKVSIDGVPTDAPATEGSKLTRAKATHTRGKVALTATPGGPAVPVDGRFELSLDPARKCSGQRYWLYPEDSGTFETAAERLASLRLGADRVELTGTAWHAEEGDRLVVTLTAGSETLLTTELPLAALSGGPQTLPLSRPVGADAGPLVLTLTSSSPRAYLLLTAVSLVEDPVPVF